MFEISFREQCECNFGKFLVGNSFHVKLRILCPEILFKYSIISSLHHFVGPEKKRHHRRTVVVA